MMGVWAGVSGRRGQYTPPRLKLPERGMVRMVDMLAKPKRRLYQFTLSRAVLLLTFFFLAVGMTWALLPQPTDCGGNNPVIVYEKVYLQTAYDAALNSPSREFVITSVKNRASIAMAMSMTTSLLVIKF